jgi:hypothetical protein
VLKDGRNRSSGSEIFSTSREDVRTNLSLTFMSVRMAMKKWREGGARRQRLQPGAEVRNPPLVEAFQEFEKEVCEGRTQPTDFLQGVIEVYTRLRGEGSGAARSP